MDSGGRERGEHGSRVAPTGRQPTEAEGMPPRRAKQRVDRNLYGGWLGQESSRAKRASGRPRADGVRTGDEGDRASLVLGRPVG